MNSSSLKRRVRARRGIFGFFTAFCAAASRVGGAFWAGFRKGGILLEGAEGATAGAPPAAFVRDRLVVPFEPCRAPVCAAEPRPELPELREVVRRVLLAM